MSRECETETLSSEVLAERAKAGCQDSFSELVRRHSGPLTRFLVRRVRTPQDAEDVAQETFVRAHRKMERYEPRYRFTTWLFTIAARLASDSLRKREELTGQVVPEAVDEVTPGRILELTEAKGNLWQTAANLLPSGQYDALWLRYGEDRSIAEIAEQLGKTRVHVKVLLHRARLRLAERLTSDGETARVVQGRGL